MGHFYARFGDANCIRFLRHRADKQTDRQLNAGETPRLPVGVGNRTKRSLTTADHSGSNSEFFFIQQDGASRRTYSASDNQTSRVHFRQLR